MWFKQSTAADTHLQYHCALEQIVLLSLMWLNCLCHNLTTPTGLVGRLIFHILLTYMTKNKLIYNINSKDLD